METKAKHADPAADGERAARSDAANMPEPWAITGTTRKGDTIIDGDMYCVAHVLAQADAARIVTCVNGCAGIANPDAVPGLLAALIGLLSRFPAEENLSNVCDIIAVRNAREAIARAERRE